MTAAKVVFVFPAFATHYREDYFHQLPGFQAILECLLDDAARIIDPALKEFHLENNNFLDDELRNQYMAYLFGCAISEYLRNRKIHPSFLSGLSMGLYAALKESGAISFRDGLLLIRQAFLEIKKISPDQQFAMGAVIGLNEADIKRMIDHTDRETQVSNQMASYSFVLSGRKKSIEKILERAKEEGAFHSRMLNASASYHSDFLTNTRVPFGNFVHSLDIANPGIPIVSVIDQNPLITSSQVSVEIIRNLYQPFNWLKTQMKLQESGVLTFIECGTSQNLVKNAKFIPGSGKFYSVNNYII